MAARVPTHVPALWGASVSWLLDLSLLSMASSAATMSDPSIYTNYVNVHLSIDKLDGTNYVT